MELKDKVVVITGGSRGFGRALAEAFLKEGAKVAICSHNKDEEGAVGKEIGALGIQADVRSEDDLKNLAEQTIKEFGKIDIWINNAGLWVSGLYAEEFEMPKVKEMFDVNVMGTMHGSRVALRHMKEKNSGIIMNIISTSALSGRPKASMYSASKWAVNGFTKAIREENEDKNILILSVFPGAMKTFIFEENQPDNFGDFMDVKDVAQKVIDNLKKENPELELIIKKENA